MKEACINRIYSVTDQVPQFSFTTLLHEATPRSRQIGKIRLIVVIFCCNPQNFKHKKQRKQRNFRNFCSGLYPTDKQTSVFVNVISVKPAKSTQMRFHASSNHTGWSNVFDLGTSVLTRVVLLFICLQTSQLSCFLWCDMSARTRWGKTYKCLMCCSFLLNNMLAGHFIGRTCQPLGIIHVKQFLKGSFR